MNKQKTLKNRLKQNKGITLIALVITIIVLLILAGVSISAITGNESAMKKAQEARTANENADELDTIKLAIVEAIAAGNTGEIDGTVLAQKLTGIATVEPQTTNGKVTLYKVTGNKSHILYEVQPNGSVKAKTEVRLNQTEINFNEGVGETTTTLTVTPDAGVTISNVSWSIVGTTTGLSDGLVTLSSNTGNSITVTRAGTPSKGSTTIKAVVENNKTTAPVELTCTVNYVQTTVSYLALTGPTADSESITADTEYTISITKPNTAQITKVEGKGSLGGTIKTYTASEITYTPSNNEISVASDGTVSLTDNAVDGHTAKISVSVTGTTVTKDITVTITVPEIKDTLEIGDYVEYGVGYKDISGDGYTNASANTHEFTPTEGWRVLYAGSRETGTNKFTGVKLISTGIPAGLYYYYNQTVPLPTWRDTNVTTGNAYQAAAGLSNPTLFNNIKFKHETANDSSSGNHYNYGYYTDIKKYNYTIGTGEGAKAVTLATTGSSISTASDQNANTMFLTDVANTVDTLNKEEMEAVVGTTVEYNTSTIASTDNGLATTSPKKGLIYLGGLSSTAKGANFGYTSTQSNCAYWLASAYNSGDLYFVYSYGILSRNNYAGLGVRPVVSLKSVDLEWNGTAKAWKITKVY